MFPIPPLPHLEAWPLPEEPPWLADSASVLQPKALLPTPRYCLPPPSYRPPRPPLFPVPPPGSCLLPPPPLPTCEGLISPHSWQDSSVTPNSKNERWRRSSWTPGDTSSSPPLPALSYSYQRSGQARPRTLVEVPLHSDVSAVCRSDPQPIEAMKVPVNIMQSTLDPTSRPFTPASYKSLASDSYEDTTSVRAMAQFKNEFSEDFSYFGKSSSHNHSEAPIESSISTSSSTKKALNNSNQGSIFADDPQVEDLKVMLPDLDNSIDELQLQDEFVKSNQYSGSSKKSLVDVGSNILPPPILPFAAHWSGKTRPPLLPTPKNFPPYGPRTISTQAPIYEEVDADSVGSLLLSNPILQFQIPSIKASSNSAPRSAYRKSSMDMDEVINTNLTERQANDEVPYLATSKKQDVIGVLLNDHFSAVTKKPRLSFSSNHSETIDEDIGDLHSWDPSFPVIKPESLLQSHPVPDEYMVAKVIGGKLPPIKLVNCHTDLLLFLFYVWAADTMQQMAASLLFERGWRFHMVEKVWLARWPGVTPERKTTDWEEGLYQYFDVKVWRRIPGWFRLNYVQLAEKTDLIEETNLIPVLSRGARNQP